MVIRFEFLLAAEFLNTIFARLLPIANAARCGPHTRTSLATPLERMTDEMGLQMFPEN